MAEATTRVLVADGERFFREAIVEALAQAGVACEAVETGDAVLARASDAQVGVLVLDIALPGLSSGEILRTIRESRPELRVIAVSAQTDHDLVLEALRQGASDYLAKPLHDEELVLAVRRALAAHDVEAHWSRLRMRLRSVEAQVTALAAREDDGSDAALASFSEAVANGVAEVVGADKTSLMLYDTAATELHVAAATGADLDADAMDPVALGEGVAGVALSLGEALLVEDIYSDVRFREHTSREQYATASLAVVPLRTPSTALGVLCATDRAGGVPFGEDELALLQLLAVPVTQFLLRRTEASAEVGRAGESSLDGDGELAGAVCAALVREIEPAAVLDAALRAVSERLGGASVALHLIDNRSGRLQREHEVPCAGLGDRAQLSRDRGLTGRVLQGGAPVAAAHPECDEAFAPDIDTALDGEVRPLLCVPLELRGKVVGVLRAFPAEMEALSARTLQMLSTSLSAAVRNVLLYGSLLESIDELSEARREAGHPRLS
ncbi:MAG: response regulator [Deltaproteobacteria bacterium]|nr:response regulator [Deltaproteobacteria bacterium]MBW2360339.1 response regulator [Deltaproteobacteria bacterium]